MNWEKNDDPYNDDENANDSDVLQHLGANCLKKISVTSSRWSDSYMCQQTRPALVQIIPRRLISDKSLSEPCWLFVNWEQIAVKFERYNNFHTRKWIWKFRLLHDGHFVSAQFIRNRGFISSCKSIFTSNCRIIDFVDFNYKQSIFLISLIDSFRIPYSGSFPM